VLVIARQDASAAQSVSKPDREADPCPRCGWTPQVVELLEIVVNMKSAGIS
jgi:hypothetical protein